MSINARKRSEHPWRDRETLRSMYWGDVMTPYQIADELGCTPRTIYTWLERHDIPQRPQGHNVAIGKAGWSQPHFYTMKTGYERWETDYRGQRFRVKVHRLLAVSEYGFDAVCNHHVHHKNGIRWDNRPDNLELVTPAEHRKYHPVTERRKDGTAVEVGLVLGEEVCDGGEL